MCFTIRVFIMYTWLMPGSFQVMRPKLTCCVQRKFSFCLIVNLVPSSTSSNPSSEKIASFLRWSQICLCSKLFVRQCGFNIDGPCTHSPTCSHACRWEEFFTRVPIFCRFAFVARPVKPDCQAEIAVWPDAVASAMPSLSSLRRRDILFRPSH